jgi:hypothetical protein
VPPPVPPPVLGLSPQAYTLTIKKDIAANTFSFMMVIL